jgi:hypothetical protein
MRNALITGLPRSGTFLVCSLLNSLPNSVALAEPMDVSLFLANNDDHNQRLIDDFFASQRLSILTESTAAGKCVGGRTPTNPVGDELVDGVRSYVLDGSSMVVDNLDGEGFDLYLKHPVIFTALLPWLADHFACVAMIRNPLAVLMSWSVAPMPVREGRAPAAERMDPALANQLDAEPDVLARQILLLDCFFRRYAASPALQIIRYEDLIATAGRALATFTPAAAGLDAPLQSRNTLELSRNPSASRVAERLLDSDNACWQFYSRAEVAELLALALAGPAVRPAAQSD